FQARDGVPARGTDLLFVGHFNHPPNADAVRLLAREVLPRVGDAARLRIVGRAVTPEIAALARPGTIDVVGPVPDVTPHLAAAADDVIYEAVLRTPARAPLEPEPTPRLAAAAGRLGYLPGLAAGTGVLVARAARWHARRLARPRRGSVTTVPAALGA